MPPPRAMAAASIARIFEEAAIAAVQKTQVANSIPSCPQLRPFNARFNTSRPLPARGSICTIQKSYLSTVTEPIPSPSESAGIPQQQQRPHPVPAARGKAVNAKTNRDTSPSPATDRQGTAYPLLIGRVTKAGLNPTVVQVTRNIMKYDKFLQKHYRFDERSLVFDPNNSLREGDVVNFHQFSANEYNRRVESGKGRQIKHVVHSILSPFGTAIEDRPIIEINEQERMRKLRKKEIFEQREKNDVQDVVDAMVKTRQNKQERVTADKLEAAEEMQDILNEKGVNEKEVERRVKQAGI